MATGVNVKCVFYRGASVIYSLEHSHWKKKWWIPLCFKLLARLSVQQLLLSQILYRVSVPCQFQQAVTDISETKEHETVMFPAIVLTHCHHSWVSQTSLSSQRSRRCCRLSSAAHTRWPLAGHTGCSSWWGRCAVLWSTWGSLRADTPRWKRWWGSHRYSSHSGWAWPEWRWC